VRGHVARPQHELVPQELAAEGLRAAHHSAQLCKSSQAGAGCTVCVHEMPCICTYRAILASSCACRQGKLAIQATTGVTGTPLR
jgi:hypothetical protein